MTEVICDYRQTGRTTKLAEAVAKFLLDPETPGARAVVVVPSPSYTHHLSRAIRDAIHELLGPWVESMPVRDVGRLIKSRVRFVTGARDASRVYGVRGRVFIDDWDRLPFVDQMALPHYLGGVGPVDTITTERHPHGRIEVREDGVYMTFEPVKIR